MKDLELKFAKVLASNGIHDPISEVVVKCPDNLIGEQMGSICEYVTIHFEEGKRKPQDLFIKKKLISTTPERDGMITLIMQNEGMFLTTFVSDLSNLCEQKLGANNDVGIRTMFPKTYHADDSEIIMQNMAAQGYFMLDKKELQSFEMAKVVLLTLAKMHGTSYCLIRANGGKESFLRKYPNFNEMMFSPGAEQMISTMFNPTFASILQMMEGGNSKEFQKLDLYRGKMASTLCETLALPNIFECANHGDCWNNNMLFSPETRHNSELIKLMFVDFQLARVSSPNVDIGYYIFTSVKPEVRKRIKELLQIYFDAISDLVLKLGEDFPFTFEEFLTDYGQKSKFGLLFGFVTTVAMEAIKSHDTSKSSNY